MEAWRTSSAIESYPQNKTQLHSFMALQKVYYAFSLYIHDSCIFDSFI